MKFTNEELLKLSETILFRMKIFQLKTDQHISMRQIQIYVLLHFIIMIEAICFKFDIFSIIRVPLNLIPDYVLYITSMISIIFAAILITSLGICSKMSIHESMPRIIFATTYMVHIYKKIFFPLNLWSFIICLKNLNNTVVHISVGIPSTTIGILCLIKSDLFLRSSIPTDSALGCLQVRYLFFHNIVLQVILILGILGKYETSAFNRSIFMVANMILSLVLFSMMAIRPLFWKMSANKLFLIFYGAIFLLTAWNLPLALSNSMVIHWTSLLLTLGFLCRIVEAIINWQEKIDLFDPKETYYRKLRGLLIITRMFDSSWKNELSPVEELELQSHKIKMTKAARIKKKSVSEVDLAFESCGRLAQFLAEEGEQDLKSFYMAKFELLSRLMSPSDNILKAFQSLLRLKKLVGDSIFTRLEARFFDMMFESRLQAFYYLRPEEKTSQETVIQDLFKNYIMNAQQNVSTRIADICLPLNQKALFLKIREKIFSVIDNRNQIYKYILGKATVNTHMMSHDLFKYNQTERQRVGETKKLIEGEFNSIKLPPSYFFPSLFTLSALVQHDTLKARKILRTFRKNLQAWEYIKAREQSLRLDVLDVHSAVLQASLQQHDRGRIVDATPNWPTMLGDIENGTIVGHNVNDLFIDILSKKHAIMMSNTFGLTRILNIKRDFYIKTFTNELKAVIFTLRLWPSLEKDLTGVVAIGPSVTHSLGQNMLLMTPEMDIIEAEEGFWSNIGQGDDGEEMFSVLEITIKLEIVNKLLSIFQGFIEEAETFHIHNELDTPLEAIYKIGQVLLKLNESCSLIYRVDENTNFTNNLRGTPLLCKMIIVEFMDVILSQLFVRFGVRDIEKPGARKMITTGMHNQFDSQLTKFMSTSVIQNVNNTIEELIKKENQHYMENMTLKEKLKIWNEEEKPTEVELILNELFKWIGNADESDVRLCPTALKKYLIRFGEVVNQFRDQAMTKPRNIPNIVNETSLFRGSSRHHSEIQVNADDHNAASILDLEYFDKSPENVKNDEVFKKDQHDRLNLLSLPQESVLPKTSKGNIQNNYYKSANEIVYMGDLKEEDDDLGLSNPNQKSKIQLNYNSVLEKKSAGKTINLSEGNSQNRKKNGKLGGSKSSKGSKKKVETL